MTQILSIGPDIPSPIKFTWIGFHYSFSILVSSASKGKFAKYARWMFEPEYEERVDLLTNNFSLCGFQEE